MDGVTSETFCGRTFSSAAIAEISEIVSSCPGLSRTELASTICEIYEWKRPSGRLKTIESRQFLEHLEARGYIVLPARRKGRPRCSATTIARTEAGQRKSVISATVGDLSAVTLRTVRSSQDKQLWYEYVDRYHYLGYRLPFGAHIRYFIESQDTGILGCLQFSSPAWKMQARDRWIGWTEPQRRRNLQKIVNNSRFLVLPWVRVKNLASCVLAKAATVVADDWAERYGYRPVLLETLVDTGRFQGTCYRAANWTALGMTAGRGRMDRDNVRAGLAPKTLYVYPLCRRFREELNDE
jgi:hypothetical protein